MKRWRSREELTCQPTTDIEGTASGNTSKNAVDLSKVVYKDQQQDGGVREDEGDRGVGGLVLLS